MKEYKIIHLSDTHFSRKLNPSHVDDKEDALKPNEFSHLRSSEFFKNYLRQLSQSKISAELFLCVTGDLTDAYSPSGFSEARKFLSDASEILKISPKRVIISPGNHDMQRTLKIDRVWEAFRKETEAFTTPFSNEPFFKNDDILIFPFSSSFSHFRGISEEGKFFPSVRP